MSVLRIVNDWQGLQPLERRAWHCGNCGIHVASRSAYHTGAGSAPHHPYIYPCTACGYPTLFWQGQHPGRRPGTDVEHLPDDVKRIYDQARDCCRIGAYDAAALLARSLLMHVAVSRSAKPGLTFVEYVDFLEKGHFTPPDSKDWVDDIRKQGNRAAHEIAAAKPSDAEQLIEFLQLILTYLFEFTGKMNARKAAQPPNP